MRPVLFGLLGVLLAAPVAAQTASATTQAGTANVGEYNVYTLIPANFGQLTATLSWDVPDANLVMVLVCGAADPQTFGVASGLLDRFARLGVGSDCRRALRIRGDISRPAGELPAARHEE